MGVKSSWLVLLPSPKARRHARGATAKDSGFATKISHFPTNPVSDTEIQANLQKASTIIQNGMKTSLYLACAALWWHNSHPWCVEPQVLSRHPHPALHTAGKLTKLHRAEDMIQPFQNYHSLRSLLRETLPRAPKLSFQIASLCLL